MSDKVLGLSTRLPYSDHKKKASLSKVEPFVRTLRSLMEERQRLCVFEEEQKLRVKGEHLEVQTSWPGV